MLAIYVHYGRCVNQALHILESDGPVMFVLVHTMDWVVSQLDRVPSADPYFDTITAGLDATLIVNCRSMADAMVKTARAYINARWVELPEDVSKFDGFRLADTVTGVVGALVIGYTFSPSGRGGGAVFGDSEGARPFSGALTRSWVRGVAGNTKRRNIGCTSSPTGRGAIAHVA